MDNLFDSNVSEIQNAESYDLEVIINYLISKGYFDFNEIMEFRNLYYSQQSEETF
ncbi:hypothetical protein SAMN04487866_1258 [Thermoactinomyces sp. DSM 45891]|nr:hypothetical protein SAMN04487866_1258 [Thermoactinomyces sp. DSM 45891]